MANKGPDRRLATLADTVSKHLSGDRARLGWPHGGLVEEQAQVAERRRGVEAEFVAATESLLARGGSYADLSVEQISAAAGRSRTAFYVYFRDKRELLMRATETVVAELYDDADNWWSGADGRRGLRVALTDVLGTYGEHAAPAARGGRGLHLRRAGRRLLAERGRAVHRGHRAAADRGRRGSRPGRRQGLRPRLDERAGPAISMRRAASGWTTRRSSKPWWRSGSAASTARADRRRYHPRFAWPSRRRGPRAHGATSAAPPTRRARRA